MMIGVVTMKGIELWYCEFCYDYFQNPLERDDHEYECDANPDCKECLTCFHSRYCPEWGCDIDKSDVRTRNCDFWEP
jgi:hypothetical protein